ncbi:hypothetical protein [Rhizobium sp. BK376]|uniref:hypothetical protein n=1 Tax=Rhizobium sp. BK376 TaxID=2512149 RepID=UPI0010515CB4|nr:hypothetical protein [Rhizobium sp. BK376]TCR89887.1 hypothetical protein EV561_104108 [Rhizobium sp. BK376]
MKVMGTIEQCREKLWSDLNQLLAAIRAISLESLSSVDDAMSVLFSLRKKIYEDLNQIQHEHALIKALEWLIVYRPAVQTFNWHWNPRSTGTMNEPDLQGIFGDEVRIAAEVTTSGNPKGVIDNRMAKTLAKLSIMSGDRFYFVVSPSMAKRARTKVAKSGYEIVVVDLSEAI